jgi:hypothetical protein
MSGEYMAGLTFERDASKSFLFTSLQVGTGNFRAKHLRDRWIYLPSYDIHGNIELDSFPVTSRVISGNFQITYLRKINTGSSLILLVGASLKEILVYTDNNTGLLNSIGLHAHVGIELPIMKGRLLSELSVPMMALNSRLPWHNTATSPDDPETVNFFRNGSRVDGPGRFRMIQFEAKYDIPIALHWKIGAGYVFNWMHLTYFQPLKSFSNSFQIKTTYTF